jgi:hypothetical protein
MLDIPLACLLRQIPKRILYTTGTEGNPSSPKHKTWDKIRISLPRNIWGRNAIKCVGIIQQILQHKAHLDTDLGVVGVFTIVLLQISYRSMVFNSKHKTYLGELGWIPQSSDKSENVGSLLGDLINLENNLWESQLSFWKHFIIIKSIYIHLIILGNTFKVYFTPLYVPGHIRSLWLKISPTPSLLSLNICSYSREILKTISYVYILIW